MSEGSTENMNIETRVLRVLALGAGYALLLQAIFTAFEIVARKLFNHSFQGVDEIGGYTLAIAGAVGFGYATVTCAHTRIDLLLCRLPIKLRVVLHAFAALVLLLVSFGMLWYGLRSFNQSISYGAISTTPLQTPLWIPQLIWLSGLALFFIVACTTVIRGFVMIMKSDYDGVEKLLKAQSQEQQELAAAGFSTQLEDNTK